MWCFKFDQVGEGSEINSRTISLVRRSNLKHFSYYTRQWKHFRTNISLILKILKKRFSSKIGRHNSLKERNFTCGVDTKQSFCMVEPLSRHAQMSVKSSVQVYTAGVELSAPARLYHYSSYFLLLILFCHDPVLNILSVWSGIKYSTKRGGNKSPSITTHRSKIGREALLEKQTEDGFVKQKTSKYIFIHRSKCDIAFKDKIYSTKIETNREHQRTDMH